MSADTPALVASFESGSCGHIASKCECDYAADTYFAPRDN